MKKLTFLVVLSLVALIVGCGKKDNVEKIDITETEFEYNIDACDKYFELAECIIDKDNSKNWTEKMKNELRLEIKNEQEERKLLNEKDLAIKCSDELSKFDSMKESLESFGCNID